MKDRFENPHRDVFRHARPLAGVDFYWIAAVGAALVVVRLFIWLLIAGGLIGEGDTAAAFLIALPVAAVIVAWFTPVNRA